MKIALYLVAFVLPYTTNANENDPVVIEEGGFKLRESHLSGFFAQLEPEGPVGDIRADKRRIDSRLSASYIYYELSFDAKIPIGHFEQTHLRDGEQPERITCILRMFREPAFVPIFIGDCGGGNFRLEQERYILGAALFLDTPGWR